MSGYEEEHNITRSADDSSSRPRRRPDLSSFFSALELVDTNGTNARPHVNAHAEAAPNDIASVIQQLANAYQVMLGETEGVANDGRPMDAIENPLLLEMIQTLRSAADDPPRRLDGVPDTFLDELDRVPKKSLAEDDRCPICRARFLEDKYPLVVRLPCNKNHLFDLECLQPWLKTNSTCPLDRKNLIQKREIPKPAADEEDGEPYDDMFG